MIDISFAPSPLVVAGKLAEFEAVLVGFLVESGQEAGQIVINGAKANMHFKHSTGEFEDSLYVVQSGPFSTSIQSDLPYGNRLEWGFYGPDSLGRVYHQEGLHFMMITLTESVVTSEVAHVYFNAVEKAWNTVVGSMSMGAVAIVGNA